jgi:hypothetical protein
VLQPHLLDLQAAVTNGFASVDHPSNLITMVPHESRSMPGSWWRLGPSPNTVRMGTAGVPLIHLVGACLQPTSLALMLALGAGVTVTCSTSNEVAINIGPRNKHFVSFTEGQSLLETVFNTIGVLAALDEAALVEVAPRAFLTVAVLLAFEAPICSNAAAFQRCLVLLHSSVSLQSREVLEAMLQLVNAKTAPVHVLIPMVPSAHSVPAADSAFSEGLPSPARSRDTSVQLVMQSSGFNVDLADVQLIELLEFVRNKQDVQGTLSTFAGAGSQTHEKSTPYHPPKWSLQSTCESCGVCFPLATMAPRCINCGATQSVSIEALWATAVEKFVDVQVTAPRAWAVPDHPAAGVPPKGSYPCDAPVRLPLSNIASDLHSCVSAITAHQTSQYIVLSPQQLELLRQLEAGAALSTLAANAHHAIALQPRMLTQMLCHGGDIKCVRGRVAGITCISFREHSGVFCYVERTGILFCVPGRSAGGGNARHGMPTSVLRCLLGGSLAVLHGCTWKQIVYNVRMLSHACLSSCCGRFNMA